MSTASPTTGPIPADVLADGEAIVEAVMAGRKPDPEVAKRVRERAEKVTEEIRQKHGVQNIGTQIIRDLRDS
jgi:hypothetical protein